MLNGFNNYRMSWVLKDFGVRSRLYPGFGVQGRLVLRSGSRGAGFEDSGESLGYFWRSVF